MTMYWIHTPEGAALAAAIIGVLGTIALAIGGYILHGRDEAQEKLIKLKDEAQSMKQEAGARETERLAEGLRSAWLKIDKLRDERATLWTRAEHEAFEVRCEQADKELRNEIRADLESLGRRLSTDLANLGNRLDNTVRDLLAKTDRA
jgi:hypothetical protein